MSDRRDDTELPLGLMPGVNQNTVGPLGGRTQKLDPPPTWKRFAVTAGIGILVIGGLITWAALAQ